MIISLYTAVAGIILVFLSLNVVLGRRKFGVALDHAGSMDMLRRIRAQANFIEYTPIFLFMLWLVEYNGINNDIDRYLIHILGILFFVGRISHAYSLLFAEKYEDGSQSGNIIFRIFGMLCTFTSILALSFVLILQYFLELNDHTF